MHRAGPPAKPPGFFKRHWDGLWAAFYGVFWLGVVLGIVLCKLFA